MQLDEHSELVCVFAYPPPRSSIQKLVCLPSTLHFVLCKGAPNLDLHGGQTACLHLGLALLSIMSVGSSLPVAVCSF